MYFLFQKILSFIILIFFLPFLLIIWLLIKIDDGGPLLYKQKRMGKDSKPFVMYKIRSMVVGAEELKRRYLGLNEANGPVFKIRNDPRYTRIGKILARVGVDELPQLINVIKGDMVLVGPRPLPKDEAIMVPKRYKKRFSVLPGITSPWVLKGSHQLTFKQWMDLDLDYINKRSPLYDAKVMLLTTVLMARWTCLQLMKKFKLHT